MKQNNSMRTFVSEEFGNIRVIEEDGKYLFCGSDVAKALGYNQPNKAIERHCRYGMKRTIPHPQSTSKTIEMIFVPEGDIYRLITHSRLPAAERFEKWVFDEVLIAQSAESIRSLDDGNVSVGKKSKITNEIMNISGIECYEKDGTAYLKLETVARGLGFTETAASGNECVKWSRVRKYLTDLKFIDTSVDGYKLPDFIPENIFYRLAMKAKNEAAERFQAKVADEIIPAIRRTGGYIAGQEDMTPEELMAKALMVAQKTLADREARLLALTEENQIMKSKAEYFDAFVNPADCTNIRTTAKQLQVPERWFCKLLQTEGFMYRSPAGTLMPYNKPSNKGLFIVRDYCKNGHKGAYTLITPKGKDLFRLLIAQE